MPNADTAAAQLQPSRFFAHTALLMAVLVFLSFPLLIHIHGLACFAWIALLVWQTRHREWHRRLVYVAAICLVAPALTRWTLHSRCPIH